MKQYKVLCIDDRPEALEPFVELAAMRGITIELCKYHKEGMDKLLNDIHSFDAIILDALGLKESDDEAEGYKGLQYSITTLSGLQTFIPRFIYSAFIEKDEFSQIRDLYSDEDIYTKGKDNKKLLDDIINKADRRLETQIRHNYQKVFEVCTEEYLGNASAMTLLSTIKNANKDSSIDSKDYFLSLRKMLELLFEKLNNIGLIPDEIFNNNGWFNPSSDFLTGKPSEYTIKNDVIHPTIAYLLRQLKDITQDAEHNVANKLRLKTDDFILENKTPFLFRSALNQLCDVLVWFKNFIDTHPNMDENRNLCIRQTWIKGEVYEVNNGWGKFISECGEFDRSIPHYLLDRYNVQKQDIVEITLKPENERHIKELRKL